MKKSIFATLLVLVSGLAISTKAYAVDDNNELIPRPSIAQRYFLYSGKSSLSILELGYTYDFVDKMHMMEAGILDFRYKYWGMSILQFEFGFVKDEVENRVGITPWVAYKHAMHFYIPITSWMAITPYVGASVDCSYLGKYLVKNYEWNKEENFFVDACGGLGFYLSGIPSIPLEIRAEYRYPVIQNTKNALSQGFFLSAHLHFTKAFR